MIEISNLVASLIWTGENSMDDPSNTRCSRRPITLL